MDLRIPTGALFVIFGIILLTMGAFTNARAPLAGSDVNLYAGAIMTIFGGILLWLAKRSS